MAISQVVLNPLSISPLPRKAVDHYVAVVAHKSVTPVDAYARNVHREALRERIDKLLQESIAKIQLKLKISLARVHLLLDHLKRHSGQNKLNNLPELRIGQQPFISLRKLFRLKRPYLVKLNRNFIVRKNFIVNL